MSFNRHITRNFNANKTHRIRYDKDDFRCQIFRFDKTYEQKYAPSDITSNGLVDWFNGMQGIYNPLYKENTGNPPYINFRVQYNAKQKGDNYRIELLYANLHRKQKKDTFNSSLLADVQFKVNDVALTNNMSIIGLDVNFSRVYQHCSMKEGINYIDVSFSPNTVFLGMVVKKYDIYEAKRHNSSNDKLTMIKATVEHTKDLAINTMTAEFLYHHELDEKLLPTDPNANRSGLIFDYRDEINLFIVDTNGKENQVFGGYISTVTVDDDLTKVTMECADRLIDLDRRYCLSEVTINGMPVADNYNNRHDYKKNYTNYSSPLKFLMNNCEVNLKTNIAVANPLVKSKTRKLAKYRKTGYRKINGSNMTATAYDNSITLRNGDDSIKPQHLVIYDTALTGDVVELNEYPNLYFHYGLGDEKWTEKRVEYSTVTVEGSTKASSTWIKRANSITSATGEKAIKPIFTYVQKQVKYEYKKNFYQSAEKTWSRKKGNCCCQSELLLTLLNAKGIGNLQYVHRKTSGDKGHVYTKVNGFVCDPVTSIGWGDYCKGYGSVRKTTNYPTKPF